jgi:hypothetical protein
MGAVWGQFYLRITLSTVRTLLVPIVIKAASEDAALIVACKSNLLSSYFRSENKLHAGPIPYEVDAIRSHSKNGFPSPRMGLTCLATCPYQIRVQV